MKKNSPLLLIFVVLLNICCGSKSFDLSTIVIGSDEKKYDLQNKNIFLQDVSKDKNTVQYYADENKGIQYGNIPLSHEMGTRITVYKGKIGAVETYADEKHSLDFVRKIVQQQGKPVAGLTERVSLDRGQAKGIVDQLQKVDPEKTRWNGTGGRSFTYPSAFFWNDGRNYSILSITIENDGRIRNKYITLSREAYINNAVFGMKYPVPVQSPWYRYMK